MATGLKSKRSAKHRGIDRLASDFAEGVADIMDGVTVTEKITAKPRRRGDTVQPAIKLTLRGAADEFRVARETIRRGLMANGVELGKEGQTFSLHDIHAAISGDVKVATARDKTASAIARERENRVAEGELITIAEHEEWQERTLLPIRQRLLALATEMAQRCNPSDPKFARDALGAWADGALSMIRKDIAGK